jgi:hypothetical protein
MPHVIIEGPASVELFCQQFTPLDIHEQQTIIKVQEAYLSTTKMDALLDCLVVEDRIPITFYIFLTQKSGRITVRLDRLTDPEKTDGVKRLLALIGHTLKSQSPLCYYGKHNLAGFLIKTDGECLMHIGDHAQ